MKSEATNGESGDRDASDRGAAPAADRGLRRRRLLSGIGATAAFLGIAGCNEALETVGSVGGESGDRLDDRSSDFDHDRLRVRHLEVGALNGGTVYLEPPVESGDVAAACDALAERGGGEIVLPAGTWDGQFAVTRDSVTLRGRSRAGVTLRTPDGVDEPEQLLSVVADDCTVERLTLDGNKQNQDVSGYSSRELQHADTLGVYGDRCTVREVTAVNSMSHSIICRDYGTEGEAASGVTDGVVAAHRHGDEYRGIGNAFVDCRTEDNGVSSNPRASLDSRDCTRTTIENCEVVGDEHTIVGITVHGGDNVTIRNNYVENRPENLGVQIHSDAYGIKAVDNHLVGGLGGVQLYNDTDDVLLRGNTVEGSDEMTSIYQIGDTASNVRLVGETVRGGRWQSVYIGGDARNISLRNCTFEGTYTAVKVGGGVRRGLDVAGCRFEDFENNGIRVKGGTGGFAVRDCRFVGTGDASSSAVSLTRARGGRISDNTFVDLPDPVYRDGASDVDVEDNRSVSTSER